MKKLSGFSYLALFLALTVSPVLADDADNIGLQAPAPRLPPPNNVATITATCDFFFADGTLAYTTVNSWKALVPIQIPGTTSGTWEDPDSGITYTFACTYTAVL